MVLTRVPFTARICQTTYTVENQLHSLCNPSVSIKLHSSNFSRTAALRNLLLGRCFPDHYNLNSSLKLTVIFSIYTHNLCSLSCNSLPRLAPRPVQCETDIFKVGSLFHLRWTVLLVMLCHVSLEIRVMAAIRADSVSNIHWYECKINDKQICLRVCHLFIENHTRWDKLQLLVENQMRQIQAYSSLYTPLRYDVMVDMLITLYRLSLSSEFDPQLVLLTCGLVTHLSYASFSSFL